ncbi:unnamed protein product [Peniophora sp. CBMAI 1063]|nr:unnamed protein product [Peniophora sp. CBMAI 1063]
MSPTSTDNASLNRDHSYGPPFDNARADLVVRASDDTFFLISRLSLEMASSVLRERLAIMDQNHDGSHTTDADGRRRVLSLPYASTIVAHLLSTILPVTLELPDDFEQTASLLAAAEELGMEYTAATIRHLPTLKQLIQSDPITAYFVASRHGLSTEMQRAAEHSLGRRLKLKDLVSSGDLFFNLHTFHRTWSQRSRALADALTKKYEKECLLLHEHTDDKASSVRCSFNRSGWRDTLYSSLTLVLDTPTAINRTRLCLDLTEFMRPTLFASISSPDYKIIDVGKLDEIMLDVETSAAQALASIKLVKVTDPYASIEEDIVPPDLKEKARDKHDLPDADVVLRSRDGVLFRTYKCILAMTSAFFKDMFSLPVSSEADKTPQIVQMAESAKTLECLLSSILPIKTNIPDDFHSYALVLAAAQKFDMEYALDTLRVGATARVEATSAHVRYGIASRLHLRPEALAAADELLTSPMTIEYFGTEICYLSETSLQQLLTYRIACQQFVWDALSKEDTLMKVLWEALGSPREIGCKVKTPYTDHFVPGWSSSLLTVEAGGDGAELERRLSPWSRSFFEGAIASHTQRTKPPCTFCMSINTSALYRAVCRSLHNMATASIAFPAWN